MGGRNEPPEGWVAVRGFLAWLLGVLVAVSTFLTAFVFIWTWGSGDREAEILSAAFVLAPMALGVLLLLVGHRSRANRRRADGRSSSPTVFGHALAWPSAGAVAVWGVLLLLIAVFG